MKELITSVIVVIVSLSFSSPVLAGQGDEEWAKCLWKTVPTTANNWLSVEKRSDIFLDTNDVEANLRLRLKAACNEHFIPEGKKTGPEFIGKKIKQLLIATKPEIIDADTIEPDTYYCFIYEGNSILGTSTGIGKPSELLLSNPKLKLNCRAVSETGKFEKTIDTGFTPDA